MQPLCFVLMPFGLKDGINFDAIYDEAIKPAIEAVGLKPLREDEEQIGGIIHKTMFEKLMLCEYAIADLTLSNANVFYELGIRHTARPYSTVLIFNQEKNMLPFDVQMLRAIPYKSSDLSLLYQAIKTALETAIKEKATDSPLYQLIDDVKMEIEHLKADIFRKVIDYSEVIKERLREARERKDCEQLKMIEETLPFERVEPGILIDLLLSYRAIEAYDEMIRLYHKLPTYLRNKKMVLEQYGLALNRVGDHKRAEEVLQSVIETYGKSSETCGILGRVYKDLYEKYRGDTIRSQHYLKRAIDTYLDGFEADCKDAYPGVNAVTLMFIANDQRLDEILPVVIFSAKQRLKTQPNYWDYATLLELYVIQNNSLKAEELLGEVLHSLEEDFQRNTTVKNLKMIVDVKEKRGEATAWIETIITQLSGRSL